MQRLGQEDSAIQELRNQIGNQAGNMQVLKGEYDRITGGVSGLQERHKNLSGEVEANIREMQTMAAMTNEINSQIADLKKQLVEEELAVEKDVKKLEASGNTTNLPFGVGIRSTVAHSISSAPTYVREDPAIKPPKPLKEMTEQEQVDWAMKMTEKEMTPEEREEAELRQALEASLRD
ncbi:hypothetical protein SARC_08127 [Sphaeroforma arctica JP610]|uniref:Uncharacterized protein n=1 Tax=Sphaeroforma arctica JP610 TaxID=667725 RepID=A0A0L0FRN1_9EUKA|nr:hypothetical protein SARC_08127 [Sphaeroforma arctica JP610]KNC79482.1 hypothetical protein SARC_08127 [Sphaeroforma arctica JP610]|eukprot:XP_014153384.1 hypothetical protein SARC_08127 [Sphaeroforma arctica JP610]